MVIVNFIGQDIYLIGDVSKKFHSSIAKAFGVQDEEIVFTATDSFVYYKGHEQTSFNLVVKVEAPSAMRSREKEASEAIFRACADFSIHTRLLFTYFNESSYYEKVDSGYVEYLEEETEVGVDDSEYDENKEYGEEDIYLGDIFKEKRNEEDGDEDDSAASFGDAIRKN